MLGFALTLVYVVLLFIRPQELYPEWAAYQIMDVLGCLALAGTLLALAMGNRPSFRGPELLLGLAFLAWSAFSVAAAVRWVGGAVVAFYGLSISFFAFLLVLLNANTRRRLSILIWTACVSLLIVLAQATRAYYSGMEQSPFFLETVARGPIDTFVDSPEEAVAVLEEEPGESSAPRLMVKRIRGLGFLADPNDLAQALASIIPLIALLWRRRRPFRNAALVLLPIGMVTWGVLLTRSRGGLVSLGLLLAAAFVLRLGPRVRRPATVAALLAAGPAFIALFGYARADSSAATRLEAWSMGLLMLKWSPVWGVGSGFFMDHHSREAHNSYVQCFAETGLVGYFLWLSVMVVTLSRLTVLAASATDPDWARWARALRLSILAFLFAALFLSRTTSPMLFFLLSLPAALCGMAERDGEKVSVPRNWWLRTLGVEAMSVILVWVTARAFYG